MARFVGQCLSFCVWLIKLFILGVTNPALHGFSQLASSQLPKGTWENGIYDYDDLKKNYIPSNKRYWDDQSKVPFLFNQSTGLWISYDDIQSINIKNDYIKKNQLRGGFYWELSSDRQAELIGATFAALNSNLPPSVTSLPSPSSSSVRTTTRSSNQGFSEWQSNKVYSVNDRVTYQGKTYRCLQAHTSLPNWMPPAVPTLWLQI